MAPKTFWVSLFMGVSAYAASVHNPDLEARQGETTSVTVIVCNSYDKGTQKCGGDGECNEINLVVGTYASTPGTICWYLPGDPHPNPGDQEYSPRIQFCNKAAGGGDCRTADLCSIAPDNSCNASGTQSMGLLN